MKIKLSKEYDERFNHRYVVCKEAELWLGTAYSLSLREAGWQRTDLHQLGENTYNRTYLWIKEEWALKFTTKFEATLFYNRVVRDCIKAKKERERFKFNKQKAEELSHTLEVYDV